MTIQAALEALKDIPHRQLLARPVSWAVTTSPDDYYVGAGIRWLPEPQVPNGLPLPQGPWGWVRSSNVGFVTEAMITCADALEDWEVIDVAIWREAQRLRLMKL